MLSQLLIALTVSLKTETWTLLASRHKRIIHTVASQCSKRFFRIASALLLPCCGGPGSTFQHIDCTFSASVSQSKVQCDSPFSNLRPRTRNLRPVWDLALWAMRLGTPKLDLNLDLFIGMRTWNQ